MRNDLRRARERAGLTQQELAERCGVTRQTIISLEAARYVPSTAVALAIARALRARVEDLFWLDDAANSVDAVLATPLAASGQPAVLASVGGRRVVHALPGDQASIANARIGDQPVPDAAHVAVEPFVGPDVLAGTLLVAGCAPALAILSQRLSERAHGAFPKWIDTTSARAVELLRLGLVHSAGTHLVDETTGRADWSVVAAQFPGRRMIGVTLAHWEAGLLLAPGNPHRVRGVEDAARPSLRLARRPEGAGAERLLERLAARHGVTLAPSRSDAVAHGHWDVARRIATGLADVGVAVRAAAIAFGLDFVPLAEERFDLVVPAELAEDARVARLIDLLADRTFRRELTAIGGYDVRETGHSSVLDGLA
jgi:molybdate-binding protein/DNA-binding XRE family transcriptional regulator